MAGKYFRFELVKRSTKSGARVGRIITPHGSISTPAFVPVGTNGVLKAVTHEQSAAAGTELMFSNTYHLMVHPGPETIHKLGGIHKWSGRNMPFITDSGGFQVFSLSAGELTGELKSRSTNREGSIIKISEDGVIFRSYRDGRKIELTPESTVQAQKLIGADIIIPLDELPPSGTGIGHDELKNSVEKSMRWEQRSLAEHLKNPSDQAMYAVVHGGLDQSLRNYSSEFLSKLPFDGFAVGGSLGRSVEDAANVLNWVMPNLPIEKPVHLLGLADHGMLRMGTEKGVDTFDSCFPTKAARHGTAFVNIKADGSSERLYLKSGKHAESSDPLDSNCDCYACTNHSRGYLHHLLKMREPVAATLVSIHNIHHTHKIMEVLRERILHGDL